MARHGLRTRAIVVVALAAAAIVPLTVTPTASAVDDPPWTHAFAVGNNGSGQLGVGAPSHRENTPVMARGAIFGFHQVSGGSSHSLAVATDGSVYAWGINNFGQLGVPVSLSESRAPVLVPGLSGITQVAAGQHFSMALRSDGTVWTWGNNQFGQLGDGTDVNRPEPTRVPSLSGIRAIGAGYFHSVAVRSDGTVVAWGRNSVGQLGDGTDDDRPTPTAVPHLTRITQVDGGSAHSMALRSDGVVFAWGSNASGQLGDGTRESRYLPQMVGILQDVTSIAAGDVHSLVARANGWVLAWGSNQSGELGDATTDRRLFPVRVIGLTGVRAVTAGHNFSAAVHHSGAVSAWGNNGHGQLGIGTAELRRLTPARAGFLPGVTQISAGTLHLLAVRPVPAPRFEVSTYPTAGTLAAEGGLRIPVNTSAVNDSTHTIALSVSGLPAGVTGTFDPPTVVAGGSSTLVLSSTEVAALGPATLTITATATPPTPYPTTVTTTFALTVVRGCSATNNTDVAIPDGGPPAISPVVFESCATPPDLATSTVEVHIVHARRGDLVLDLIDPTGRTIRLKNSNPADTRPNMNARFQITLNPDVRDRLFNTEWRLQVTDVATGAEGHVASWTLFL